jgi:allantoinase
MPGSRQVGMDHDYYAWSPISRRPRLAWPNDAKVAFFVVVNVEHFEVEPALGTQFPSDFPGGLHHRRPVPDLVNHSIREYGNRIGVFRVMAALDKYGVKATAAIDVESAFRCGVIVDEIRKRNWEFAAHGRAVTAPITSDMPEEAERHYISSVLQAIKGVSGSPVRGWLGPEYSESYRTPGLLGGAGVDYVLDWPNDEQPYRMNVSDGQLVSLPLLLELDDVFAHWNRRVPIWTWADMVTDAFDQLCVDGAKNPRVMGLNLHPWLIGQPFRVGFLEQVLEHICSSADVHVATAGEIVDLYLQGVERE